MHFLYPSDPFRTKQPDEFYAAEVAALRAEGFSVSVVSLEDFQAGSFRASPVLPATTVTYRGWMLSPSDYKGLVSSISQSGANPLTDAASYLATHHLPNWYPLITEFTPETRIFPSDADLVAELRSLDWPAYFIKDYVKSLKTSVGSCITTPEDAATVAAEMLRFRGTIEGGFVRRAETFSRRQSSDILSLIQFRIRLPGMFRQSSPNARSVFRAVSSRLMLFGGPMASCGSLRLAMARFPTSSVGLPSSLLFCSRPSTKPAVCDAAPQTNRHP